MNSRTLSITPVPEGKLVEIVYDESLFRSEAREGLRGFCDKGFLGSDCDSDELEQVGDFSFINQTPQCSSRNATSEPLDSVDSLELPTSTVDDCPLDSRRAFCVRRLSEEHQEVISNSNSERPIAKRL